eukprot:SAG25_NODE_2191_length_1855_cov_1.302392_1_plen_85_part_00
MYISLGLPSRITRTYAISLNSELLGAEGGVKAAGGTPVSLSITLAGVSLPSPAYTLGFKGLANKKGEQTLRAWSDWRFVTLPPS